MRKTWPAVGLLWLVASPLAAQESREESQQVLPPEGAAPADKPKAEKRYGHGLLPEPGPTSGYGPAEFTTPAPPSREQARRESGPLFDARLLGVDGEAARLRLPDGEVTLRAGDSLGDEVVKSVRGRQIVLRRPARPGRAGGDALVIAEFDAAGVARVRVVWSDNPGAPVPPEVR
jgi:hypothetical protein